MEINARHIIRDNSYTGANTANSSVNNSTGTNAMSSSQMLANLTQGQFFRGLITDIRSDNSLVQILLSNEQTINASLSGNIQLNIGENVIFQVKEHSGDKLVITPTSYADSSREVISKALLDAGIPETDKNIVLVKELMNYNQPINKESIHNLQRQTKDFPTASVSTLVEMDAHKIPLTKENIAQYESYKNLEYKFTDQINTMADDVVKLLADSANDTSVPLSHTTEIFESVIEAMTDPEPSEVNANQNKNVYPDISTGGESANIVNSQNGDMKNEGITIISDTNENIIAAQDDNAPILDVTSKTFTENVKEMIIKAETNTDYKSIVDYINENITDKSELADVFSSPEVKETIKEKIFNRLMIDPEVFKDENIPPKERIDKMYEKLEEVTSNFEKVFEGAGKSAENLMNSSRNLNQNMNFMGNLNNLSSFVQIPMKLSNSEANAELYVYNKKRGKVVNGETLTAFLHLDMESLGATDVNVSLTKNRVSVRFSMEDSSSTKLLNKHLSELTDRLESLGYHTECKVETVKKEEPVSPAKRIFEKDESAVYIKKYLFDIRA